MNSSANKESRRQYVMTLNQHILNGKQVIWLDETNFNLFCGRTNGWSRKGNRATQQVPSSSGPNVHVIGVMSCEAIIKISRKQGPFCHADCNSRGEDLFEQWQALGN